MEELLNEAGFAGVGKGGILPEVGRGEKIISESRTPASDFAILAGILPDPSGFESVSPALRLVLPQAGVAAWETRLPVVSSLCLVSTAHEFDNHGTGVQKRKTNSEKTFGRTVCSPET